MKKTLLMIALVSGMSAFGAQVINQAADFGDAPLDDNIIHIGALGPISDEPIGVGNIGFDKEVANAAIKTIDNEFNFVDDLRKLVDSNQATLAQRALLVAIESKLVATESKLEQVAEILALANVYPAEYPNLSNWVDANISRVKHPEIFTAWKKEGRDDPQNIDHASIYWELKPQIDAILAQP